MQVEHKQTEVVFTETILAANNKGAKTFVDITACEAKTQ